ncbi:MAG: SDR family oxidoreductase [Chloroflexi bacterium]|nr:SDR family oxidoreductase [Chloroflexota bacterium]
MSLNWFNLAGRVAVVTGAGANGGNGHATALALAGCGADVLVSDIDDAGVEQTVAEVRALGRRGFGCHCDAGDADQIVAMFALLDQRFGQVDILVNNVGIGHRSRPEDLSLDDWRRVFRVNNEGAFLCSMEAGRRMIARGQGGSIVNISSIAGSSALGRGNFVYSASKGGINQFTRELAVEWSIHGIRVNAIQPAQIMTPALRAIFERSQLDGARTRERMLVGIPLGRFGEPEDVAKAAVFLASDAASFVTGHLLPVDGGNLALNAGGSRTWPTE